MFKKYRMKYHDGDIESFVDFYVHHDKMNGFRACVWGRVPRNDVHEDDYDVFRKHTARLERCRRIRRKTDKLKKWEAWAGQDCLAALWDKLAALPFTDMRSISQGNPFKGDGEPVHDDLPDPEEIFEE